MNSLKNSSWKKGLFAATSALVLGLGLAYAPMAALAKENGSGDHNSRHESRSDRGDRDHRGDRGDRRDRDFRFFRDDRSGSDWDRDGDMNR